MSLPVADLVSLEFRSRGFGRELYSAADNEYRKSDEFPEVVEEVPSSENGDIASALNEEFSKRGFSKTQLSTDDEHAAAVPPPEKYLSPLDVAALVGAGVLAAKEVAQSFKKPSYKTPGKQSEFKSLAGPSKNYGAEGDDEDCECDDEDATFHGQLGLPGGPEQYSWSESKVSRDKAGKFRHKGFGNSANRKAKARKKKNAPERGAAKTAKGVTELSTNEKVVLDALAGGPLTLSELAKTTQMSDSPNSPLLSALSSLRDSKHIKAKKVDGEDKFEVA